MLTDGRLYRARALEPIASLGDVLFLTDQTGPLQKYSTPFMTLKGIEPIFGLTPHGLLLLWSQAATAPAGYGTDVGNTSLIPEAQTGNIAAGASVKVSNPKILQGQSQQLLHMRFALRTLALTGIKEHDVELKTSILALGKFGLANAAPGFFNMADQFQDPADAIDSPAQNANQTLPAVYPAIHSRDVANLTEMFLWEQSGPVFQIFNNGAAALTAGAIGLRIWGYRYDLAPVDGRLFSDKRWINGDVWACPPADRIIVVPTAPYTAQPGQQ